MRLDTPYERGVRSRAAKLSMRGCQVSHTHVIDPRKPYCDAPIHLEGRTSPYAEARTLLVEQFVPCRKCSKCLQFRQMKWREKAIAEIANSQRTWFVTLTFAPVHLAGVLAEAQEYKSLGPSKSVDRAAYGHVQMYLDRLRKAARAKFRYLAVFERGELTGRAHYHILLHEQKGSKPITKRVIESRWRSIVHCRLVDFTAKDVRGASTYVTKYTLKSVQCRLRASNGYGTGRSRATANDFPHHLPVAIASQNVL